MQLIELIDEMYKNHTPYRLTLKKHKLDAFCKESTPAIIQTSFKDLSEVLTVLYGIWLIDQEKDTSMIYGDTLLAFIGDKLIRHWPNKEFPFQSDTYTQGNEKGIIEH